MKQLGLFICLDCFGLALFRWALPVHCRPCPLRVFIKGSGAGACKNSGKRGVRDRGREGGRRDTQGEILPGPWGVGGVTPVQYLYGYVALNRVMILELSNL